MRLFWWAVFCCLLIVLAGAYYVIYAAEDGAALVLWAVEAAGFVPGSLLMGLGIALVLSLPFPWIFFRRMTAFSWTVVAVPLGLALVLVGFIKGLF